MRASVGPRVVMVRTAVLLLSSHHVAVVGEAMKSTKRRNDVTNGASSDTDPAKVAMRPPSQFRHTSERPSGLDAS